MEKAVRPVGDRIYVRPDMPAEKTPGGLFIPFLGIADDPTNPRMPCTGTVVAVGPGAHTRKGIFVTPDVQAGDRILFSRFAGAEKMVKVGGELLRCMAECDVQAVIEPAAEVQGFNELTV